MKDWDHIEWKEDQEARKAKKVSRNPIAPATSKSGEGDAERAIKKEQEEDRVNRDNDASWYGTTT